MSETKHISLRFSNQDLKSGDESEHNKDIITSFSMSNSELSKHIKNKKTLTELCSGHFASSLVPNDPESLIFYRKSKKHKDYVLLETEEDFKSLSRSLQVKNLLKLNIQRKTKKKLDDELKPEDAESTSQDAKRRKSSQDFTDNLSKSLFFELGEAVLQTAFEHFKDAVSSKDDLETNNEAPAPNTTGTAGANTSAKENASNSEPKAVHHQASCDSCNPIHFVPIVGPRYKCLLCNDFDLCAKCMVKKVEIGGHTRFHPMAKISTTGQYDVRPPLCGNTQRRQHNRSHFGALGLAGPWTHPHPTPFFNSYHGHGAHGPHRGFYRGCGFAPAPPNPPPPPPPPAPTSAPTPPNPPAPSAASPQFSAQGNDIIYDIPLGSCSLANRDKLENILRSGNIDDFFRNVDLYIEESRRYKDLINSLNTDQDGDEKYACLLSLVEQINLDNAKDGSLGEEVNESTAEGTEFEADAIVEDNDNGLFVEKKQETPIEKKDGSISVETLKKFPRCLALFLTNNSIYAIPGEKLEFEFFNDNDSFKISVPVPKDFLPEETKYANLRFGHDNPDFPSFGTCKLRIPTSDPSIFMEGDFLEKGTTLYPVVRERKESEKIPEDKESKVLVALHIKADFFAQIVVTNYTESEIDCSDLRFEIINCFQQSICNLVVHKRHAILPGRTSRFNISLSSAHLKYPFKLVMKNDSIEGECDLSLKNLSGTFKISKNRLGESSETDSAGETASFSDTDDDMQDIVLATKNELVQEKEASPETETDIEIREAVSEEEEEEDDDDDEEERGSTPDAKATTLVTKSVEELRLSDIRSSSTGEVHSMVLPTLPRESTSPSNSKNLSSSEYLDANSTLLEKETSEVKESTQVEDETVKVEEEVDADYDIVSSDAGEDFGSDYEILSPVTSNNQ